MKGLLFLLVFISTTAFGQLKCCFVFFPNHVVTDSTVTYFSPTSPLQNVARSDSAYTVNVTVPYGFAFPTLTMRSMNAARSVMATAVGSSIISTFHFKTDTVNTYELKVQSTDLLSYGTSATSQNLASATFPMSFTTQTGITKFFAGKTLRLISTADNTNYVEGIVSGYVSGTGVVTLSSGTIGGTGTHTDWLIKRPNVNTIIPGVCSVQPGRFSQAQADLVIDVATYGISNINGGGTDRTAGYKIFFKGTKSGTPTIQAYGWHSSNADNPVIFQFYNCTMTSSNGATQLVRFDDIIGVVITGTTTENTAYGLQVTRTAGNTENFYWIVSGSKNVTVAGLQMDNGVYTQGGSGFVIQVQNNATWNNNTTHDDRVAFYNCNALNTGAEGYYFNHTNDDLVPPAIKGRWLIVYNCNSNHTSNEGFQSGGWDHFQIFRNTWLDAGLRNTVGQMNAWVIKDGEHDGAYFMNYGQSNNDIVQAFNNRTGGNIEIFSNLFITTGGVGMQNCLFRLAQSTRFTQIKYHLRNNTTIARTNDNEQYSLYNDPTYPPNTMTATEWYAGENVFVSTVTTGAVSHNSYVTTNTIVNNKAYLTSNIGTILYKNQAGGDYRIGLPTSPLFNTTRNATINAAMVHPLAGYDYYGNAFNASNVASGHDAGMTMMWKY